MENKWKFVPRGQLLPVLVSVPFKLLYTVIRRFMPVFSKGTVS